MARVLSGSKMYRISAPPKIHAALHFVQKAECTKYTLFSSWTELFFKENIEINLFLFFSILNPVKKKLQSNYCATKSRLC